MLAQDSSTGYVLFKERIMASITIRNLPSDIVGRLKALAAGNGRSMEQETREMPAAGRDTGKMDGFPAAFGSGCSGVD
jgi:hypothetical protein